MIEHAAVACGKDDVKPVQGVSLIWYTDQGPDGSNPAASSMDVAEELLRQGVVYMEPSMPHILSMPRHLIVRYSTTQKAAKDQRLNIWQYGDFREDLSG
ncbi:unnamed protein product [Protopolystoma xenopodis]|uniref:TNase-like domain-containing protein n=1 Tax=Protopolystoma xenopodis TaxID=117903 RepID=A0A3S5FDC1_9PLAT|nr:unnamed protein product [Protopolystoma xenopodis]